MGFEFAGVEVIRPLALLAVLPLGLHAIWISRRLTLLSPGRRWTAVGLRLLLLALLLAALAGTRLTRQSDELKVMFVVDQSESVPPAQREWARAWLEQALETMGKNDQAGVVAFGGDAAVERAPEPTREIEPLRSVVDRSRTNLAEAINLAMACFVGESQKRVVILSDGNQNTGDAVDAARAAAAAGVAVDVVALEYENRNDVVVDKVIVENRVSLEEPFELRVLASSRQGGEGTLSVLQDGRVIGHSTVRLDPDKRNVFVVSTEVRDAGFHTFEVQLDIAGDSIPENNRGFAFTYGEGKPRVLLVDGDEPPSPALAAALSSEQIEVVPVAPTSFPAALRDLQGYDAVVFNNVGAGELTQEQMRLLEQAVHVLGIGFAMIGGEQSFGAGGWNDSPIERILPVEMELKNEKILPQGALALIIHTVEIPEGQYWAEQISLAALDALSPRDLMGLLYYGFGGGESWLFPMQEVGDKGRLRNLIRTIQPGDMPDFDRTLQMAHDGLMSTDAGLRHIVIISDGDPSRPAPALINKMKNAKITISTVVINPHTPRDKDIMQELAQSTGGQYYDVTTYNRLPQIFMREAAIVRKSLIFDEPFTPQPARNSPLLTGVAQNYPVLGGYVGTSRKDLADVPLVTENDDPLLAHWQYGTGKSLAFTSDAKQRWGSRWLTWDQYTKFWTQSIRWILRSPVNPNYQVQMDVEGSRGKITIDAVDADGAFKNFMKIGGQVISPTLKPLDVDFRQVAPGRYEAEFEAAEAGTYMLGATAAEPQGGGTGPAIKVAEAAPAPGELVTGGTAVSYSPEFRDSRSNLALLARLADVTRPYGRVLRGEVPVFAHNLPSRTEPKPLWPWMLWAALPVFLFDIFTRRVLIGWGDLRQGMGIAWAWARDRMPGARRVATATDELLEVKRQVRGREEKETGEREEFLKRLKQARPESSSEESPLAGVRPRPGAGGGGASGAGSKPAGGPATGQGSAADKKGAEGGGTYTEQLLKARKRARGDKE